MALIDWLSSYYKEDSNWNDSFGGRNLTDSNITYGTWSLWNCAIFNGTSSKQTGIHNLGTGNIDFSYYGWVYITGTQARWEFLSIGNQGVVNQGIFFSIRTKSGWNDAVYFDYSLTAGGSTTARVNYNAWNFIAIRKTGSTISVRINNNAFENLTAPATLNVTTNTLIFGDYGASLAFLNGKIDEVWLFTTQKTNSEYDSFYNGWSPLAYPFSFLSPAFLLNFL